jgi:hypothetical protein
MRYSLVVSIQFYLLGLIIFFATKPFLVAKNCQDFGQEYCLLPFFKMFFVSSVAAGVIWFLYQLIIQAKNGKVGWV